MSKTNSTPGLYAPTPIAKWGSDHWSLLGYLVSCVDGEIDRRRLRCNPERHPMLRDGRMATGLEWDEQKHSTRLKDGTISGHDDWDCLDDIEAAGLVEVISLVNGFFVMHEKGSMVGHQLRRHKSTGGNFANFE